VLAFAAASTAFAALPAKSFAATYPDHPITVIMPLPAGGVLDLFAHGADTILRQDWGQSLVLENDPGATSNIGVERVVRAKPDGYTLLLTVSAPMVTNKFLIKNMPFDPMKDLEPVILVAQSPLALVVHKSVPITTLQEYIAYAKAHPGEMNFGSSGVGSPHHIAGEYLSALAGIKLNHVPYSGSADSIADVTAGHIQSAIVSLGGILAQAKAGNVRILAITDDKRCAAVPDVPTIGEIVPGFKSTPAAWNGVFVPAKTPQDIVMKLNAEFNKCLKDSDLSAKLEAVTLYPIGGTPEDVTAKINNEVAVTKLVVDKIGLVPQ
jgi:tripartite-type tricarboxylate transporter receptor subunit TctC